MKASEVLQRYAAGERNFRGANLRGQSFKGRDLSGADFSGADIRGTNFSQAILRDVNFTSTKAGLECWWMVSLVVASELLALITGTASGFAQIIASSAVSASFIKQYTILPSVGIFVIVALFFLLANRHGLTLALSTLTWTVGVAWTLTWFGARANAGDWTLALVLALGWAWLWAWAGALAELVASRHWVWIWIGSWVFVWTVSGLVASAWSTTEIWLFTGLASFVLALLGTSFTKRALAGDIRFSFVRSVVWAIGSTGGTSFWQADLSGSDFSHARLRNSDLRSANLAHIYWQDAEKINYARLGQSILANPAVCELLVTRNGYKKSYIDANLRSTNLNGVNLEQANLRWADLSEATLHNANLRGANLSETLVLGTDFTAADLTGACLEAWNLDHTTKLDRVNCQYIYLEHNQQERRPSSGDFAPGEFTKLFQEVLDTVDLIFRNGVDWKAFVAAFKQVQVENEDTPLEIQSIENKGDGVVVVRVSVPPNTNKEKIHSQFNQQYELALNALEAKYQAELQAKDGEIALYREQSANMWGVINSLANRPINVQAIAKAMNDSTDQSRNISIGGNVNATNSAVNLGEVSGNVSNTIQQLQQSPHPQAADLAALLKELQTAIEAEPDLKSDDKTEALEQVGTLAKAGENPQDGTLKKLAGTSIKILKGTIAALPDTAKLAEACSKLLPLITKALGLPI